MPKTLPKLTTAMEKSIDKKKPKRKEEIKVEEENVDPAPELVDTAPVDDERSKLRLKLFNNLINFDLYFDLFSMLGSLERPLKP